MKAALCSLTIWFAVACGNPLAAQEVDGLNADLKESFYNSRTALVATLQLTALGHGPLMRTFAGFFDPESLAILKQGSKNYDANVAAFIAGPAALADGLVAISYERATVVGLEDKGVNFYLALPLGFQMDESAFMVAKGPLETLFAANKFNVGFSLRDEFVLVHAPAAALPMVDYSSEVERVVMTGLAQPRGIPAAAFVVPTNAYVRNLLGSASASTSELGKAIGQADYIGGYLVSGDRPELHLYARFSGDAQAKSVKTLYDQAWEKQMADAKIADQQHEQDIKDGTATTQWYIDNTTMFGRMQAASAVTLFGGVLLLDLDTSDLRQITGALVDGYFRSPPKSP